jgi:AraC-like DNA-binding protein
VNACIEMRISRLEETHHDGRSAHGATMKGIDTVVLGRSRSVALHEVRCLETSRTAGEEEEEPTFSIAVPMGGVFVHHGEGRSTVGAPGVALFMNPGDVHRTAHPEARGDRTIELALSDDTAEPFTRVHTDRFPSRAVRVPPAVDLEIRLLARAAAHDDLTALELDERAHELIAGLLELPPMRSLTARQSVTVEAALEYLAWHFTEDIDLPKVAETVGSSPHHLSRLFHAGTGITLSGFRTELRVRAALERIGGGASDLSAVACDVGFFDHAHMTKTFRRLLGETPTQLRAGLAKASPVADPELRSSR